MEIKFASCRIAKKDGNVDAQIVRSSSALNISRGTAKMLAEINKEQKRSAF
jgi:hypothetical protein